MSDAVTFALIARRWDAAPGFEQAAGQYQDVLNDLATLTGRSPVAIREETQALRRAGLEWMQIYPTITNTESWTP